MPIFQRSDAHAWGVMSEDIAKMAMDALKLHRLVVWLEGTSRLMEDFQDACRERERERESTSKSKRARAEPREGPDANEAARARGDCESDLDS